MTASAMKPLRPLCCLPATRRPTTLPRWPRANRSAGRPNRTSLSGPNRHRRLERHVPEQAVAWAERAVADQETQALARPGNGPLPSGQLRRDSPRLRKVERTSLDGPIAQSTLVGHASPTWQPGAGSPIAERSGTDEARDGMPLRPAGRLGAKGRPTGSSSNRAARPSGAGSGIARWKTTGRASAERRRTRPQGIHRARSKQTSPVVRLLPWRYSRLGSSLSHRDLPEHARRQSKCDEALRHFVANSRVDFPLVIPFVRGRRAAAYRNPRLPHRRVFRFFF